MGKRNAPLTAGRGSDMLNKTEGGAKMAISKEYFDFVCGQLDGIGGVTGRKLFG